MGSPRLRAVFSKAFDASHCFLCGRRITKQNSSPEHVFPKWLQEMHRLWDEQLILGNGTSIPYRQLVIPCCAKCNNDYLSGLEATVSAAFREGPEAVRALPHHTLFLWLGKIFYGLIYKELFLRNDRSSGTPDPIATPEFMTNYEMHHYFLQSVRIPMQFQAFHPASIYVFRTQVGPDPRTHWDFSDGLVSLFISLRISGTGILAVLQDGGALQTLSAKWADYHEVPLHPLQFTEIATQMRYQAALMNRVPKYVMMGERPITVIQLPLQGYSTHPIYDEWDQSVYADLLAHYLHLPKTCIFSPPDQVMTWLRNEDNSIKELLFDEQP